MPCWVNARSGKRRIRGSAVTPRGLPDCHSPQGTLSRTDQSRRSYSPRQHMIPVRASSAPSISRPHSGRRPFCFPSLNAFISFFSAPFLAAVKVNGQRATEISRVREIEGAREELQLAETMKKGGVWGSAKKMYSVSPVDYRLLEEVGHGASGTVYRAMYIPCNEVVAVKCLDLDRCNNNLDDIRRQTQTMSLIDHPNVVKGYCSFVVEHSLWVVMPFMEEGSCFHLMKVAYPDGFKEHIIGSILKETLKALEYLHKHGHIHRNVKAGNILLDSSGVVKLSDFGVTADMFDKGDRQHSRNTFVGSPCWMAPEVMQPGGGYDFKADIWSFGITALELALGHAPFSKYPPMKVLLMTLQNAPPGLDYDRDKKFSKSFKEVVAMCLVKDQTKRPTAEKLLEHSFFKNAMPPELSMKSLLADLPPLWDRMNALQLKNAEQLALKKMPSSEQEALSKCELGPSTSRSISEKPLTADKNSDRQNQRDAQGPDGGGLIKKSEYQETDLEVSNQDVFYRYDKVRLNDHSEPSTSMHDAESRCKNQVGKKPQLCSGPILPSSVQNNSSERGWTFERAEGENQLPTESSRCDARKATNLSGPVMLPNRASANSLSAPTLSLRGYSDSSEDKSRVKVVQIKGRFSVTSENVAIVKGSPLTRSATVGDWLFISKQVPVNQLPKENINISLPASILIPHLQNLFQQTTFQQDLLKICLNSMQQIDLVSGISSQTFKPGNDVLVTSPDIERERLLLVKISELQARMINLIDELIAARLKNNQLQQQLITAYSKRNGENV